jgi:hypothetical protein
MRAVLVLAVLATVTCGCSVVNAPSDHMRPIPATEFCSHFRDLLCRGYDECCPTPDPGASAACPEFALEICAAIVGGLAVNPITGYDELTAARMIAEGNALIDVCDVDWPDWFNSPSGFQSVLEGTIPGGMVCATGGDPTPAERYACIEDGQACNLRMSGNFYCGARQPLDGQCSVDSDCLDTLRCVGALGAILGQCQLRLPNGMPCTADAQCASFVCSGAVCSPRTPDTVFCGIRR